MFGFPFPRSTRGGSTRRRTAASAPVRSRRARWRRQVLRRTAAFLALVAALALTAARMAPDTMTTVIAVEHTLPAGHLLAAEDLSTVEVPAGLATTSPTTAAEVIGRRLAGPIDAGEPLSRSRLTPLDQAHLPPGTAPVHVLAADPAALDLLHPGALVDVYVPATPEAPTPAEMGGGGSWQQITGSAGAVVTSIDPAVAVSPYGAAAAARGVVLTLTRDQIRALLAATEPGQPLTAHLLARPD